MDYGYYKDLLIGKVRNWVYPYLSHEYDASFINEHILISDLGSVYNPERMKEDGITHILTVVMGIDPAYPEDFRYKKIDIRDTKNENFKKYFDECFEFIENAVSKNGKVIVHCAYGISRSSTIVIAYLIRKYRMSYEMAYNLVKNKRNIIEPNEGFVEQLKEYAERWQKRNRHDV